MPRLYCFFCLRSLNNRDPSLIGVRIDWKDVNGAYESAFHSTLDSIESRLDSGAVIVSAHDANGYTIRILANIFAGGTTICDSHLLVPFSAVFR